MGSMRNTGGNRLSRSGNLTSYGRTPSGQRTKNVSRNIAGGRRTDTYWGGGAKPDGYNPYHGHRVRVSSGRSRPISIYNAKPAPTKKRRQSTSLLDTLFPPPKKRSKKKGW